MTLDKLTTLRERYAERVTAHQEAMRAGDSKTARKAKRSMTSAGKTYLKGIQQAFAKHDEDAVWAIVQPK